MINNYFQAAAYLNSLVNYERQPFFRYKECLKLERSKLLFDHLNISFRKLKAVHIAGTKGKGSTAHFCACLLAAGGFKTGLYTSPHFFDFRERIQIVRSRQSRIERSLISPQAIAKNIREIAVKIRRLKLPAALGKPTFFEVCTAVAVKYFLDKRTDFTVLETGLGGRLDTTNIINPRVGVITRIGYDHTDKLGKKLADIAAEKAGIIKPNTPLVCARQRKTAQAVISRQCRLHNAPLFIIDRDFKATRIRIRRNCTLFDFGFGNSQLKNLKIIPKGKHQVENAACALAAVSLLEDSGGAVNKVTAARGLRNCLLEGRFEVVRKNPLLILDIAHNESSFAVLNDTLKTYFPHRKVILVFACSRDKNPLAMLNKIDYGKLIITRFHNPRAKDPDEICRAQRRPALTAQNINEALRIARTFYTKDALILVSGSLFLVSEVKELLRNKERGKD